MNHFTYNPQPARVVFGAGRVGETAAEADRLGGRRCLVVSTSSQKSLARKIGRLLGNRCVEIDLSARPHVPAEIVTTAVETVRNQKIDLLIAVGGGSTIGLAKGITLETGLPILAVPTTYAGSEMTAIWGISRDGRKTTGREPAVKPKTVIYDPELLVSLPAALSLTSGINAMAHAVEALYAENADPISLLMAEEGVRALAAGLPQVVQKPADLDARTLTFCGAWLSAAVLDQVGMALHHKLCHTLGGSFGLPHAATHTVVLPYATAFNASHAPNAMAALARALDCPVDDVAGTIQDIARLHGGPVSLAELGFSESEIDRAADLALQNRYFNPRPFTRGDIRALLQRAFEGVRP